MGDHANLIQATKAKAYKHSFAARNALRAAINQLVGELNSGHNHDRNALNNERNAGHNAIRNASNHVATAYAWQTHVMCFSNGGCIGTTQYRRGQWHTRSGGIRWSGNRVQAAGCSYRVL